MVSIGNLAFGANVLEKVVLGSSVQEIGDQAFAIGRDSCSGTVNEITHLINKSGNAFNWDLVFNFYNDETIFVTGIYSYYQYGNKEVLITAE